MSDSTPDPGAPPPPPSPGTQPASLGVRFGARLIDGLIVGIPTGIVLAILELDGFGFSPAALLGALISSVVYVAYFAYLEAGRGQTIGKRLVNIRVVGPDGGPPTQEQAFRRNAWLLLGIVPIIGDLAMLVVVIMIAAAISSSPEGKGHHDDWAGGTRVVMA